MLISFAIILITLNAFSNVVGESTTEDDFEYGDYHPVDDMFGQAHFPEIKYEEYVSRVRFIEARPFRSLGMASVYNLTHELFNFLHPNNASYMLPDYVVHTNKSAFNMGRKFEENDWLKLLQENNLLILLWLLPLCLLAIFMPFVAMIYFCFCCCRCKKTCAPCDKTLKWRRSLCSILLFLLILGLVLAFILALLSLKQMSRNIGYSYQRMREGSRDTCIYLADVSQHLRFLMLHNFERLALHISDEIANAHKHVLLELADTSGANALVELQRILKNMEAALRLLRTLENYEKYLRFIGSLHRDSWRGVKRDLIFSMLSLCKVDKCAKYLQAFMRLDTSHCLHVDDMPNTTVFIGPVETAIDKNLAEIAEDGLRRLSEIEITIKEAIAPIRGPIMSIIENAESNMKDEYVYLNDLIEAVISDIDSRDRNAADTFEDIHEKMGVHYLVYGSIACLMLFLIITALIFGLLFGFCVRRNNAGSYCLILAIIMIFSVFTFITVMGLYYYILGMVTYQAVCRRLDSLGDYERRSLRTVDKISACRPDQHIYDLLYEYKLYDIERILTNDTHEPIDVDDVKWEQWEGDLSEIVIISMHEFILLNHTLFELYPYMGKAYMKTICKNLRIPPIDYKVSYNVRNWVEDQLNKFKICPNDSRLHICATPWKAMADALIIENEEPNIIRCIDGIKEATTKIDALILSMDDNFGETYLTLYNQIKRCENFIRYRGLHIINTLGLNLTESLKDRIREYRQHTQWNIQHKVGHCGPLIYHMDRGTNFACRNLIDPINGFWIGLLLSSILFLPLLLVAHCLICPYRHQIVKTPVVILLRHDGCPTCSGAPYVPPPVVLSGGQDRDFDVIDIPTVDSKTKQD
ncbi:prominin-like protein isoform X1 [Drosophila sulfurigaster albostrigata]|uniref:prominin-like protein isoform X1 n=2 Tax=Drosophila sulfurigaster albostrigata TaxID=89887 RepID=UPI002D21B2BA|nr:prominin-like protein isoform X1 [Drosophila sulfurigaster albostrigata]